MCRSGVLALFVVAFIPGAFADTFTIDFEGLSDGTSVVAQYPGLLFSNATILTAGNSLNEFEFPPNSGTNVVSDAGGAMSISFLTPVTSASGFFTYSQSLALTAFDASNNSVATTNSAFNNNLALSGDAFSSPNELLSLSFAGGISSLMIAGDPAGGSFVLDDLTFTTVVATVVAPVPEPGALVLLATALACCCFVRLRVAKRV
jgi:hypothetical protein